MPCRAYDASLSSASELVNGVMRPYSTPSWRICAAVVVLRGARAHEAARVLRGPEARDERRGDRRGVDLHVVLLVEVLAGDATVHGHLVGQRMVRAREEDELLAARELAGRRVERLIEAGAEIDRDVGDGRRLDRAREAERLARGLAGLVDADVLSAARARELREELVMRVGAGADREEARARAGERATEALEERLGAGLAGGRRAVADVDDRRLLLAVEARERGLEHRAEIGRAARSRDR